MHALEVAPEAAIHRHLRELADRALAWLALRDDGSGAPESSVELVERRGMSGPAGQALRVRCVRRLAGDDPPAELSLVLEASEDGVVRDASATLIVCGRRKALRQVLDRLPALPGKLRSAELVRDPRLPKEEPSRLLVVCTLAGDDAVEDLITRGLAALDALADETASRDRKARRKR